MELKEFLEHALNNVNDGVRWNKGLILDNDRTFVQDLKTVAANYSPEPVGILQNDMLLDILKSDLTELEKITAIQTLVNETLAAINIPPAELFSWRGWGYPYPRTLSESFVVNEKPELHKALINPSGFYQRVNQRVKQKAQLSWSDVFGFFQPQIADHTVSEWLFDLSKK